MVQVSNPQGLLSLYCGGSRVTSANSKPTGIPRLRCGGDFTRRKRISRGTAVRCPDVLQLTLSRQAARLRSAAPRGLPRRQPSVSPSVSPGQPGKHTPGEGGKHTSPDLRSRLYTRKGPAPSPWLVSSHANEGGSGSSPFHWSKKPCPDWLEWSCSD